MIPIYKWGFKWENHRRKIKKSLACHVWLPGTWCMFHIFCSEYCPNFATHLTDPGPPPRLTTRSAIMVMQSLNLGWLYRIIKWVTTMAYHGMPWLHPYISMFAGWRLVACSLSTHHSRLIQTGFIWGLRISVDGNSWESSLTNQMFFGNQPSGKHTVCYGKIHHFQWINPLFLWPAIQ